MKVVEQMILLPTVEDKHGAGVQKIIHVLNPNDQALAKTKAKIVCISPAVSKKREHYTHDLSKFDDMAYFIECRGCIVLLTQYRVFMIVIERTDVFIILNLCTLVACFVLIRTIIEITKIVIS